jgi:hypothetical protein
MGKTMETLLSKIGLSVLLAFAAVATASADSSNDAGKSSSAKPTGSAPNVPTAFSATYTLNGSSPTQLGRMTRDATPSTCAAPKAYPGTFNTTTSYLHTVSSAFVNPTASPVCATITLATTATCNPSGTGNVFAAAYLGSFNSADFSVNYLGDSGSSLINPSTSETFEIQVPANGTVVFNLNEANSVGGEDCTFTLSSPDLISAAPAAPTIPAPTLDLRNLILVGLSLLALGLIVIKRRSV